MKVTSTFKKIKSLQRYASNPPPANNTLAKSTLKYYNGVEINEQAMDVMENYRFKILLCMIAYIQCYPVQMDLPTENALSYTHKPFYGIMKTAARGLPINP